MLVTYRMKCQLEGLRERRPPWLRQIITPILPNVKLLSPGGERLRFWINTYTTIWLCYCYDSVFFAHLLILEYQEHRQNLISSSFDCLGPLHKISSQSVHNVLSNVVHRQTNRQTNATKNITSFAKEAIIINVQ